ncbi:hypothetical protein DA2_3546 [Desulfovibrio sp. A2]|nr:hypothetical protein DA2_3546 [Desulfovibrio sp. A2]
MEACGRRPPPARQRAESTSTAAVIAAHDEAAGHAPPRNAKTPVGETGVLSNEATES